MANITLRAAVAFTAAIYSAVAASAERQPTFAPAPQTAPAVWFNESLIAGLNRTLPLDDTMAIFETVFAELPVQATVYPTENYYYFHFAANGRTYSGNFRLSPDARAEGRLHFAYFDTSAPMGFKHLYLGDEHGVRFSRAGPSRYAVSYGGKTVTFLINHVPQEPPELLSVRASERFVGRSIDESGLAFLLLYDSETKGFAWVLDETGPVRPQFGPLSNELLLDGRTYFVFYDEAELDRRVLIGVRHENIAQNNIYDGPFDQLPDNYLDASDFSAYVLEAYPGLRGMVNERGEVPGGETRLAVTPYRMYLDLQELVSWVEGCRMGAGGDPALYRTCLYWDYQKALYAQ